MSEADGYCRLREGKRKIDRTLTNNTNMKKMTVSFLLAAISGVSDCSIPMNQKILSRRFPCTSLPKRA